MMWTLWIVAVARFRFSESSLYSSTIICSLDPVNLHIPNLAVSHITVPGTHIQFPGGDLYVALIQINPFVEPFIEREPEVLAVYAILKL